MPDYVAFNNCEEVPFENIFTAVKDDMIKVLKTMLVLNPGSRCTCSQALQMPYFSNEPPPTPPHLLPQPNGKNSQEISESGPERSGHKRALDQAPVSTAKRLNFDID